MPSDGKLRIALVQTCSQAQVGRNLAAMKRAAWKAAQSGAQWVLFPEMAYQMSEKAQWKHEVDRYPEYIETFGKWARELGVVLLPGTLREPSKDRRRHYNSLPVLGTAGRVLATYRKLHLFQAQLSDRRYNEGAYTASGSDTVCVDIDGVRLGLSICFDLRFPELYRKLRGQGAQVFVVPSAFIHETGKAHWEVLLRARAIENQVFVLAPNQTGKMGTGSRAFGRTMAVSPWGTTIKCKPSGCGSLIVDLDLGEIKTARQRIDAWTCRRREILPEASTE